MSVPKPTPPPDEDLREDYLHNDDTNISTLPFVEQHSFGRGLWKSHINFVPATANNVVPTTAPSAQGKTVAEKYLNIMFPNGQPQPKVEAHSLCGICGKPFKEDDQLNHYLSPSHQAALPRSVIPSAIDRSRMGLKYLEKYGYDVDARIGLGAAGQGMLFPLVPKEKRDKLGLGIDKNQHTKRRTLGGATTFEVRKGKLDAGKVRMLAKVDKKRHETLQKLFYGNDDVEKYLEELGG